MTLYRETLCEHGQVGSHDYPDPEARRYARIVCPGGSREEVTIDYEAAIAKHNELYPVPLSARGEGWTRQIVDAALHTEKETASTAGQKVKR